MAKFTRKERNMIRLLPCIAGKLQPKKEEIKGVKGFKALVLLKLNFGALRTLKRRCTSLPLNAPARAIMAQWDVACSVRPPFAYAKAQAVEKQVEAPAIAEPTSKPIYTEVADLKAAYFELKKDPSAIVKAEGKIFGHHKVIKENIEQLKGLDIITCDGIKIEGCEPTVGPVTLMPSGYIKQGYDKGGIVLGEFLRRKEEGKKGEKLAIEWFKNQGYKVVDVSEIREWQAKKIDLLIEKEDKTYTVDVKYVSASLAKKKNSVGIITKKGEKAGPIFSSSATFHVFVHSCTSIVCVRTTNVLNVLNRDYATYSYLSDKKIVTVKNVPVRDLGFGAKILESKNMFEVLNLKQAFQALSIGLRMVIWNSPLGKVIVGHNEDIKKSEAILKVKGVMYALTCRAEETIFEPWISMFSHRDLVLSSNGTVGVQGLGITLGNTKKQKVKDCSLAFKPQKEEKQMKLEELDRDNLSREESEWLRQQLVKEIRRCCNRRKDGSITMKFKNTRFMQLWNFMFRSDNARPIIPGTEETGIAENIQGCPLHMVSYEGHFGVDNHMMPVYKLEDTEYLESMYKRIGFGWKGPAGFGIYGKAVDGQYYGQPEEEHARDASRLREQYIVEVTQGENNVRIIWTDFSRKESIQELSKMGVFVKPRNCDEKDLQKLISGVMHGTVKDLKPEIDGTIWISSGGPYFSPSPSESSPKSTFQFRGSCVFSYELGNDIKTLNEQYEEITKEVASIFFRDRMPAANTMRLIASTKNATIKEWRGKQTIAEVAEYFEASVELENTKDGVKRYLQKHDVVQAIAADLMMRKAVKLYTQYFESTEHYGAYLKGLIATQSFLKPGVILMDINAVKDISKKYIKERIKATGSFEAPNGFKYVLGMMQDYSRGGIRVASQANTYVRSHYKDEFVMAEHIDRFIDLLTNQIFNQISTGQHVTEVLRNFRKAMNFTNAGDGNLGESFFDDLELETRGFTEAMWNHSEGRRVIKNLFKTVMNRYRFGFMTEAMKKVGTFVSVKSYITDLNIIPAAHQNHVTNKQSVLIDFQEEKFEEELPITVVLFKNEAFWKAMETEHALGGILRYPVSNSDMFSGVWIVSPEAILNDDKVKTMCGFAKFDEKLLEWYFRGLSQGIYANSITIKELLCGDSDGDTAGLVPFLTNYKLVKTKKTIKLKLDNGDAKMLWAIHETRDMIKRPFAELEGFTHLQGTRRINHAAVENILGESNLAVGGCALLQQSVKAVLDTNDKGLFVIQKDEQARLWKWFVNHCLVPVYKLIPCSLELAIMSQKKDLMTAFHSITDYLIREEREISYGPSDRLRNLVLIDEEVVFADPSIHSGFFHIIESTKQEMENQAGWANTFGLLIQEVMDMLDIRVKDEHGDLVKCEWVSNTRTRAMGERENPETLLADQGDEAWGIILGDNFDWTNNHWVNYIRPHFVVLKAKVEGLIYNERTYGEDQALRTTWNRSYDRGAFADLGCQAPNSDGYPGSLNRANFFEDLRFWFETKIKSRLFGLNLHGFNGFASIPKEEDYCEFDSKIKGNLNPMVAVLVWSYFQEKGTKGLIGLDNSVFNYFKSLNVDELKRSYKNKKQLFKYLVATLNDPNYESKLKSPDHVKYIDRQWELHNSRDLTKIFGHPKDVVDKALLLYRGFISKRFIEIKETEYMIFTAGEYLGLDPMKYIQEAVEVCNELIGANQVFVTKEDGTLMMSHNWFKGFIGYWKQQQKHISPHLAGKFRKETKARIQEVANSWNDPEYQAIFTVGHQEVFFEYNYNIQNLKVMRAAMQYGFGRNNLMTDYVRELVSQTDVPMSICQFMRPDNFLFEVVSSQMQSKRVLFTETCFQFTLLMASDEVAFNSSAEVNIKPLYFKGEEEVHAIEVSQGDHLIGWIVNDPTSRILFYFKDIEMRISRIFGNLNRNTTKKFMDITTTREKTPWSLKCPISNIDEQEMMIDRLEAHLGSTGHPLGAIEFKVNMIDPAHIISGFINGVNKVIGRNNGQSKKSLEYFLCFNFGTKSSGQLRKSVYPIFGHQSDRFIQKFIDEVVIGEAEVSDVWKTSVSNAITKIDPQEIPLIGDFEFIFDDLVITYIDGVVNFQEEEQVLPEVYEYEEASQFIEDQIEQENTKAEADEMFPDEEHSLDFEEPINNDDYSHYDNVFFGSVDENMFEEHDPDFYEEPEENEEVVEKSIQEPIEEKVEESEKDSVDLDDLFDELLNEDKTEIVEEVQEEVEEDVPTEEPKVDYEKELQLVKAQRASLEHGHQLNIKKIEDEIQKLQNQMKFLEDLHKTNLEALDKEIKDLEGEVYRGACWLVLVAPSEYKGHKVVLGDLFHPKHGGRSAARFNHKTNTITLDVKGILECFENKYYAAPRVEGVHDYPEDTFEDAEALMTFVLEHEHQHSILGRAPKDDMKAYAAKENEVNEAAFKALGYNFMDLHLHTTVAPITQWKQRPHQFLSNMEPCKFTIDGVTYFSVEQYYQAMKFDDPNIVAQIMATTNGYDAKTTANKYKKHIRENWDKIKNQVMWKGLLNKFKPGHRLSKMLLATGEAELIHENTWGDIYWGEVDGKGRNILGRMLMDIRSRLANLK